MKNEITGETQKFHYICAWGRVIAVYEQKTDANNVQTNKMHYIHTDFQGSYQYITDENKGLEQTANFDAWGNRRDPANWTYNNVPTTALMFDRGYTGHEHLEKVGLINMIGRIYDPKTSRFLSADNIVAEPGNVQSYNRYSYCLNSPLMYTDPSGWVYQGPDRSWEAAFYDAYKNSCTFRAQQFLRDMEWYTNNRDYIVVGGSMNYGPLGYVNGPGITIDKNNCAVVNPNYASNSVNKALGYTYVSEKGGYGKWFEYVTGQSGFKFYKEINAWGASEIEIHAAWQAFDEKSGKNGKTSGQGGFNEDKAISYLKNNFILPNGAGQCINHMVPALIEGGITGLKGKQIKAACLYGPILKDLGFGAVNRTNTYYKGDIAIIQGYDGGKYCKGSGVICGHIQMYDGNQWISDFPQPRPFWPGRGYADATPSPSFEILHWVGN